MTQSQLEAMVSLQATEDRLTEVKQRLEGIPDWMRELHEEHQQHKSAMEALEVAVEEARRARREAEAAIEEEQDKLKRYQSQINEVKNEREYGALLGEIDNAKKEVARLEDEGFAAMEAREKAEQEHEAHRQSFKELDERYAAELAKWEGEKPALRQQVTELEAQIAELRERIPRPYLVQFERIQARYQGRAVAVIRRVTTAAKGPEAWHCGVCNYRVRPQVVVEIKNEGSLTQCDNCKRFLYTLDEATEVLA